MMPFSYVAFLLILAAFVLGFAIGQSSKTSQNAPRFGDLDEEEAKKVSEKGRRAVAQRIGKRKERILKMANDNGKITNDDVEDLFCISDTTANNYLSELEAEGKLTQVGETGRGVHYVRK